MNKKIFLILALFLVASVFAQDPSADPNAQDPSAEDPNVDEAPPTTGNNSGNSGNSGNKCHNSCSQCDLNICKACTVANSKVDPLKRACVCNDGFYAESISPLVCKERISGNEVDQCEKNMGINIADFQVNTQCYYATENQSNGGQKDFVISEVTIDTAHSFFDEAGCRNRLKSNIQYRPKNYNFPKEDQNYIALNPNYISDGNKSGEKTIKIPLIDVYDLAFSTTISADQSQIVQLVYFRILIGYDRGNQRINLRAHRWLMTVYTNRKQVQTFTIDVDIQRTESCQDGQECIIIADLDVTGNQYQQDFNTLRANNQYIVGDWMYMRIWFKDATYLKQLSFQKLYFKNDSGQVFDHTSLTDSAETKWNHAHNSLHVKLKLIEPSAGATVQVNMLIETASARRFLQDSSSVPVKQQFKADIFSSATAQAANQDSSNEKTNSLVMIFGLINILALSIIL